MGNQEKERRTQLKAAVEALCEGNHRTWTATSSGERIVLEANAAPAEPVAAPGPVVDEPIPARVRRRSASARR